MATSDQQPPVRAAQGDLFAAGGPDSSTLRALARSRALRTRSRQLLAKTQHIAPAAAASRAQSQAGRDNAPQPDGQPLAAAVDQQVKYAKAARARLAALAADVAATEDNVAYVHDQLAASDSKNAARYRQAADEARRAARRAREFQRNAAEGVTGDPSSS